MIAHFCYMPIKLYTESSVKIDDHHTILALKFANFSEMQSTYYAGSK